MARYKGQRNFPHERDFPHLVAVSTPPGGLGKRSMPCTTGTGKMAFNITAAEAAGVMEPITARSALRIRPSRMLSSSGSAANG